MILLGRVQNGVVVFENGAPLADGTVVEIRPKTSAEETRSPVQVTKEKQEALRALIGMWKVDHPPSDDDVASDRTWNYVFDAEGNLTQKTHITTGEVWLYFYDHRNQLTRAQHKSSAGGSVDKQADFKHDVLGNRVERSYDPDGVGTTVYPVGNEAVYRKTDGTGGQTTSFAYSWFSNSTAVESVQVTLPTVTTQNMSKSN